MEALLSIKNYQSKDWWWISEETWI